MGISRFRGEVEAPVKLRLEGIWGAAANGSDFGFSLCDALEPFLDNRWKGVLFTECAEAGEGEGGREICAGAGGRGIHGECAAGRFERGRMVLFCVLSMMARR